MSILHNDKDHNNNVNFSVMPRFFKDDNYLPFWVLELEELILSLTRLGFLRVFFFFQIASPLYISERTNVISI